VWTTRAGERRANENLSITLRVPQSISHAPSDARAHPDTTAAHDTRPTLARVRHVPACGGDDGSVATPKVDAERELGNWVPFLHFTYVAQRGGMEVYGVCEWDDTPHRRGVCGPTNLECSPAPPIINHPNKFTLLRALAAANER
jgi:hypothetical protein